MRDRSASKGSTGASGHRSSRLAQLMVATECNLLARTLFVTGPSAALPAVASVMDQPQVKPRCYWPKRPNEHKDPIDDGWLLESLLS